MTRAKLKHPDIQKKTWLLRSGKNCERFEILAFLKANKLAWSSFRNPCRRYEAPGSEPKGFTTQNRAGGRHIGMFASVPLVSSFMAGDAKGSRWVPCMHWLCAINEEL